MSDTMGILREWFSQTPSKTSWEHITQALETWLREDPTTLHEAGLPYCVEQLSSWPTLNLIPKGWWTALTEGDLSILALMELCAPTSKYYGGAYTPANYFAMLFGEVVYDGQNASFDGRVLRHEVETSSREYVLREIENLHVQTYKFRQNRWLRYVPGPDYTNACHLTTDRISIAIQGHTIARIPLIPEVRFHHPQVDSKAITVRPKGNLLQTQKQSPDAIKLNLIQMEILEDDLLVDTVPIRKVRTHSLLKPFQKFILTQHDWLLSTSVSFDHFASILPTLVPLYPLEKSTKEALPLNRDFFGRKMYKRAQQQTKEHEKYKKLREARERREEKARKKKSKASSFNP